MQQNPQDKQSATPALLIHHCSPKKSPAPKIKTDLKKTSVSPNHLLEIH